MIEAARALHGGKCDEMVGHVPRCALPSACRMNFQIVQAHHDHCRPADVPPEASHAFHEFVGVCSECHVLRDRLCGSAGCLRSCEKVDCADLTRPQAAFDALATSANVSGCSVACGEHYALLQAYHDSCEGIEAVSVAVRDGFHRFADSCAASAGCASMSRYANPNAVEGAECQREDVRNGSKAQVRAPVAALVVLLCAVLSATLGFRCYVHVLHRHGRRLVWSRSWPVVRTMPSSAVGQQEAHKAALLAAMSTPVAPLPVATTSAAIQCAVPLPACAEVGELQVARHLSP